MEKGMQAVILLVLTVMFGVGHYLSTSDHGERSQPTKTNIKLGDWPPKLYMTPEQKVRVDMLMYLHVKGIPQKFKDVEVFLDWMQENIPDDYESNYWLIGIRRAWPKFNEHTKHKPSNQRLAWDDQ
jgi:hypothetical protein